MTSKELYISYEMHPIDVDVSYEFAIQVPESPLDMYETPIIINSFNRLGFLKKLVDRLLGWGYHNLYIIDNASTYQPLLDYYLSAGLRVFYVNKNVGYLALWKTPIFEHFKNVDYVYSDADVLPSNDCPGDVLFHFKKLLDAHPSAAKIGFSLRIDDLPDHYELKEEVLEHEHKFWERPRGEELYEASIDTTFALYRAGAKGGWWLNSLRCAKPYWAHHLPWYENSANPSEEDRFYQQSSRRRSHWVRSKNQDLSKTNPINQYFDQVYCINLDRRGDRWARAQERFDRAGIAVKRVSAVDGAMIPTDELPSRNDLRGIESSQSIRAICGGWLSHRSVYFDARIHCYRRILVFEDDVVLSEDINDQFREYLSQVPEDWRLLYFGGNHVAPVSPINRNIVRMKMSFALHAYAVHHRLLPVLLRTMTSDIKQIPTVVDVYLGMLHKMFPSYCFSPSSAWQEDGFSDYQERDVAYPFLRQS